MAIYGPQTPQNYWSRFQGSPIGLPETRFGANDYFNQTGISIPGDASTQFGGAGGMVDANQNGIDDRLEGLQGQMLDQDYQARRKKLQLQSQQRYWKNMQQQAKAQQQMAAAQGTTPQSTIPQQPQALQQWNQQGNTFNTLNGQSATRMRNPLNDTFLNNLPAGGGAAPTQPFTPPQRPLPSPTQTFSTGFSTGFTPRETPQQPATASRWAALPRTGPFMTGGPRQASPFVPPPNPGRRFGGRIQL